MKRKGVGILFAMTILALFSGCEDGYDNSRSLGEIRTESVNEKSGEKEKSEEQKEDYIEENRIFFIEKLGLSENRAKGAAQMLEMARCGAIADYEDKIEGTNAYTITLINMEGEKYFTSFDMDGFIGPIKDEEGEYLYAPVE